MGRRSPANPRYQKGSELGKTRRSAASAKPKRSLGESAAQSKASSSSKKGKKKERPRLFAPLPTTPEFKRWRKIWMALLAAAIVFSLGAWQLRDTMPGAIALALAYGCIFGSLYIDFAKMRPLRKAAIAQDKAEREGHSSGGKKTRKKDNGNDKSSGDA